MVDVYKGLDERRKTRFERLNIYAAKHPDIVDRLEAFFAENPRVFTRNLLKNGFATFLNYAGSVNFLKEYFGVDREGFNTEGGQRGVRKGVISDEEWQRRYELFKGFVKQAQGRFKLQDLSSACVSIISKKYGGKVNMALFDVCLNGGKDTRVENFIPFANYAVQVFLRNEALFSDEDKEQDRETLESGAYEGLINAFPDMDFNRPLVDGVSYLFRRCIGAVARQDNFIGNLSLNFLSSSHQNSSRIRAVLRNKLSYLENEEGKVLKSFEKYGAADSTLHEVKRFFANPEIFSLDEMFNEENIQDAFSDCFPNSGEVFDDGLMSDGVFYNGNQVYRGGDFVGVVTGDVGTIETDSVDALKFIALQITKERERDIFLRHIVGGEGLKEVGNSYGRTRERVRQIEAEILQQLREKPNIKRLAKSFVK